MNTDKEPYSATHAKQKIAEINNKSRGYVRQLTGLKSIRTRARHFVMSCLTDVSQLERWITSQAADIEWLKQLIAQMAADYETTIEAKDAFTEDLTASFNRVNDQSAEAISKYDDVVEKFARAVENLEAEQKQSSFFERQFENERGKVLAAERGKKMMEEAFNDLSANVVAFLEMNGINAEHAMQMGLCSVKIPTDKGGKPEIKPLDVTDIKAMLQVDDNTKAARIKFAQLKKRVRTYLDAVQASYLELDQIRGKNRIQKADFEKIMAKLDDFRDAAGMSGARSRFHGVEKDG